jgi:hypothetical protein
VADAAAQELPPVAARPVVRAAFGILRRRFPLVAGAALVVFGVGALVDVLADEAADRVGDDPGIVAAVLAATSMAFIGAEFFAGLLDRVVGEEERGHPRQTLGQVLRTLPYGRLIAADLLLMVGTAALALLLLVPGLVFYAFFCLVGPVVVMEDRKVFAAFRRSARLVRTRFWLVFLLVVLPVLVEEDLVHGIVAAVDSLGPLAVFAVNALAGAAVGSVVAVVEVTLAHRLAMRNPEPAPRSDHGADASGADGLGARHAAKPSTSAR